jgi:ribosomal RNA-processing protein 12
MVDSNVAVSKEEETPSKAHISKEKAAENIQFLKGQAESWLAVFFNVFGSMERDSRNTIGNVICAWASIASESVSQSFFLSKTMPFLT